MEQHHSAKQSARFGCSYFSHYLLNTDNSSFNSHNRFILDSGATQHFVCTLTHLYNVHTVDKINILTATGVIHSSTAGDFNLFIDGKPLVLRNAVYVPQFNVNIISISCLKDEKYHIAFLPDHALIERKKIKYLIPQSNITKLWECTNSSSTSSYIVDPSSIFTESSIAKQLTLNHIQIHQPLTVIQQLAVLHRLHHSLGHRSFTCCIK